MRDAPTPAAIAAQAPARLVSFDLAPKRAIAMRRCAEAVARGRVDLHDHDVRRLLAIRDIGSWTVEMLGLHGQGRMDVVPAGDLGFLKIVGRLTTGNPRARADEAEVRGLFERYGEWKGLAGAHLVRAAMAGLTPARWSPGPALRRAGTRWSAAPARPARAA
jgi:DNA-3-methyladenine glycosylase II